MAPAQDSPTALDTKIEQIERVLTDNPDDVGALMAYGEANMLRGRLLEAIKSYQRLAAIRPDSVECYLALGKIYFDSGLITEALGILTRVLQTAPTNVEGHILLHRLQKSNGNLPPEWVASLATYLEYLPGRDDLSVERAKLETKLSELDREIIDLVRAVEQSSNEPAAEFCLQMARSRRARIEESMGQVQRWEESHRVLEENERAQEAERRRLEDEERARQEAERIRLEEERQRQEEEQRRLAEERQRQEEELLRQQEAERLRLEEEERARQAAEQAAEAEAQRQRDEEERVRREQEEAERLERERQEAEAAAVNAGLREREAAYTQLREALEPTVSVLMKTKGVTSVLVMARDGMVVHQNLREELDTTKLSNFVRDALGVLSPPEDPGTLGSWHFWVLEFARGILVLQKVTADYYLVVVGQAGSNFGVLTWTIDKNKPQLEAALAGAPPV